MPSCSQNTTDLMPNCSLVMAHNDANVLVKRRKCFANKILQYLPLICFCLLRYLPNDSQTTFRDENDSNYLKVNKQSLWQPIFWGCHYQFFIDYFFSAYLHLTINQIGLISLIGILCSCRKVKWKAWTSDKRVSISVKALCKCLKLGSNGKVLNEIIVYLTWLLFYLVPTSMYLQECTCNYVPTSMYLLVCTYTIMYLQVCTY